MVDLHGELSEGAGGEVGQPLRDVLKAVGPHDRDADDAGGSRVGKLREGGRGGARHDRCEGDIVAAELLGSQAKGRCDSAAGGEEGCEYGSVAGEVQHRLDAAWVLPPHGSCDVAVVVDDVVGAVFPDERDLVIGAGGGDDVRAARLEELDGR